MKNLARIAVIVEGHGECEAVPILIRRIARTINPTLNLQIDPVLRVPASRLKKTGELERTVQLAALKTKGKGGILILLDCDEGCPANDGPELLKRATGARSDMPVAVVLAKREYEAWFLAAAESLRGLLGLPDDLRAPDKPEEIRGAKEWLEKHMPAGNGYSETSEQPEFTRKFDLQLAQQADSFDKCFREIVRLLTEARED